MATAKLFAVLLIALQCWAARSQTLTPGCNPGDYGNLLSGGMPLPVLPSQYMITAEVNMRTRNRTVFATEYFDEIGNRARIENTIDGTTSVTIADYNTGQAFVFPDRDAGRACTVYPITLSSQNIFLVSRVLGVIEGANHTVHIAPPFNNIASQVNNSNTNYSGVEIIRGIPTHHWEACYVSADFWYRAHFYITYSDQWTLPFMSEQSPVLIEGVGQRLENGTVRNISDVITYVLYRNGSDAVPDEMFQVPTGLPCRGRRAGKPLPAFPRFFSSRFEFAVRNIIVTAKTYYDLDYRLFRVDGFVNSSSTSSRFPISGPIALVHDFDAGLQYIVSKRNSGQCNVQLLNATNTAFDGVASDEDNLLHIRTARDIFFAGDQYNYSYEGVTTIRGVQVEGWSSIRDRMVVSPGVTFTNALYEIFFTRPGTAHISDYSISSDPAVWRVALSGNVTGVRNGVAFNTTVSFVNDLSGFSSSEPPLDVFDVLPCYRNSDFVEIALGLPVNAPNPSSPPSIDMSRFHGSLRRAMIEFAKNNGIPLVTPLQITAIRMRGFDVNLLKVSFHITGVNSLAPNQWTSTPQRFADLLQRSISSGSVPAIDLGIGAPAQPVAVSLDPSSGTPTGTVVGIAIGLFILGMLVSALLFLTVCGVLIFCKRRSTQGSFDVSKNAAVDYERQNDNVALSSPSEDNI